MYFLGRDHQLTAVYKDSGRVRWSIALSVQRVQTVGFGGRLVDGKLIVGDQDIFAVDSRDGTILWRFAPPKRRRHRSGRSSGVGEPRFRRIFKRVVIRR